MNPLPASNIKETQQWYTRWQQWLSLIAIHLSWYFKLYQWCSVLGDSVTICLHLFKSFWIPFTGDEGIQIPIDQKDAKYLLDVVTALAIFWRYFSRKENHGNHRHLKKPRRSHWYHWRWWPKPSCVLASPMKKHCKPLCSGLSEWRQKISPEEPGAFTNIGNGIDPHHVYGSLSV